MVQETQQQQLPRKKKNQSVRKKVQNLFSSGAPDLTWKELQSIERRRRAILRRTELPFVRILLFWDGTVLKVLSQDGLLWTTVAIYSAIRVGARVGLPEFVSDLGGADIGVIGGFLSFFLVFFVVASNRRFDILYGTSMQCEARIFDVASLARTTLPRDRALRLVRYMNAVHIAGYVGVSDSYTFDNFFANINQTNRLLTKAEVARMTDLDMNRGAFCYRELVTWCCADITNANEAGLIDGRLASQFRDLILKLGDSLQTLYDYDDQPVSFFYVHFVCLLSAMYLPLFSIAAGLDAGTGDDSFWVNDLVQGLIVLLQAIFVIGLRLLAVRMSDPYGSDVEDLSVMHYVHSTWLLSNQILDTVSPEPVSAALEEAMVAQSRFGEDQPDLKAAQRVARDEEMHNIPLTEPKHIHDARSIYVSSVASS